MKRWRDAYFDLADGFPSEWRSPWRMAIDLPNGESIGEYELVRLEMNGWQVN